MKWLTTLTLSLLIAPALQAAEIPAHLTAAVANAARSDKDRERDARDKPAELMQFAGIKPGMKVADVFGGGGYWTELLAYAVGPEGQVDLINNPPYKAYAGEEPVKRFANARVKNAAVLTLESADMKLAPGTYDLILIFMSYHDLYWVDEKNGWPAIDAGNFLDQLQKSLKPGGHLLIVDHSAENGTGKAAAQDLHRIEEAFARSDIESHGFLLARFWQGYKSPGDDRSKPVFDESVRGKTDRFVHLYRKL